MRVSLGTGSQVPTVPLSLFPPPRALSRFFKEPFFLSAAIYYDVANSYSVYMWVLASLTLPPSLPIASLPRDILTLLLLYPPPLPHSVPFRTGSNRILPLRFFSCDSLSSFFSYPTFLCSVPVAHPEK